MKKNFASFSLVGAALMSVGVLATLASCGPSKPEILIWGSGDHEDIYLAAAQKYAAENEWDVTFTFAGNGDSGAYSNMSIDPQVGAAVYTYANDMLINLNRIGALSPVSGDNLTYIKEHHVNTAVESGKIGSNYYGYPLTADNGFFMYYNAAAFRGTDVWDSATDDLKEGYTFLDLYNALDQTGVSGRDEKWNDGIITWAMGDSWYISGIFFATGGDYRVTYDDEGKQESAECWFAYTEDASGTKDYTVGLEAAEAMKNTVWQNGEVSKHFLYSDSTTNLLNTNISNYLTNETNPLAAAICGTWVSTAIKEAWGDDARATVLPMVVGRDGEKYQFQTFSGFKLMGVNPMCAYARESEENLLRLHDFAKYLTDAEVSLQRYESTGAGPSNLEAQENEKVKEDFALLALNEQFDLGARVQESVPANYWTPIQNFGAGLYDCLKNGTTGAYDTESNLKRTLAQMQADVVAAAQ